MRRSSLTAMTTTLKMWPTEWKFLTGEKKPMWNVEPPQQGRMSLLQKKVKRFVKTAKNQKKVNDQNQDVRRLCLQRKPFQKYLWR